MPTYEAETKEEQNELQLAYGSARSRLLMLATEISKAEDALPGADDEADETEVDEVDVKTLDGFVTQLQEIHDQVQIMFADPM